MEPPTEPKGQIKFMTYNVWSREDVVVYKRMQAIGASVGYHKPDVIFFQEVTPYIRSIFESFSWWKDYQCSPVSPEQLATGQHFCLLMSKYPLTNFARWKFANSPAGRSYPDCDATKPIRIATTELELATPPAPMWCLERYAQAEHAVTSLNRAENVVFGGDMCWRDDTDRPFPLLAGWIDAWSMRFPRDNSWTYDGLWNEEVVSCNGFSRNLSLSLKNRSDRFVCKLKDYQLESIELIGDKSLGFVYYKPLYDGIDLSPSCHRGLIMTVVLIK
ncbi:hypothetical protein QOZ80_7AG0568760 [Eleusine coracana subsp. coracana]|nr:hypothetical protein QOZ80_7AG0568760 [Eleusine coracana subsp. coracana]